MSSVSPPSPHLAALRHVLRWSFDNVIGPFPDQVGWPLFIVKWISVGVLMARLTDVSWLVPHGLTLVGLTCIAIAMHFPDDE